MLGKIFKWDYSVKVFNFIFTMIITIADFIMNIEDKGIFSIDC